MKFKIQQAKWINIKNVNDSSYSWSNSFWELFTLLIQRTSIVWITQSGDIKLYIRRNLLCRFVISLLMGKLFFACRVREKTLWNYNFILFPFGLIYFTSRRLLIFSPIFITMGWGAWLPLRKQKKENAQEQIIIAI